MSKPRSPNNRTDYDHHQDFITAKSFFRQRRPSVLSITDQGNNIWRYTLDSDSNIEDLFLYSKATFAGCDNAANDGTFHITTINRTTPYVEVDNENGVAQGSSGGYLSLDEIGRASNVHVDPRTDGVYIGDGTDVLQINSDGSINVVIPGTSGTSVIHTEYGTFTNTTETKVAEYITSQNNVYVEKVFGEATTMGTWRVYYNTISSGGLFAVYRTSSQERNCIVELGRAENIPTSGDKVIVTFEADRYRSTFLGASSSTFTRIEGYY